MEAKKRFENLVEVGHKARKEAEDFLNRWLNDSTKGWAVRTDVVNEYEDDFSVPLAMCLN
ncbi:MAG: hypothetical protein ACYTEK_10215 [Planctomycetota bacterium]|jgi:hypothetical protein